VSPGDTFLDFHPTFRTHLWVIVATPGGDALAFNFTTRRAVPTCDTSCVIRPGEHPFVRNETVVEYRRGLLGPQKAWDDLVRCGGAKAHDPVSAPLLLRIQEGALASRFTVQAFQRIIRDLLGRP
jgi:hypothetical protein